MRTLFNAIYFLFYHEISRIGRIKSQCNLTRLDLTSLLLEFCNPRIYLYARRICLYPAYPAYTCKLILYLIAFPGTGI